MYIHMRKKQKNCGMNKAEELLKNHPTFLTYSDNLFGFQSRGELSETLKIVFT